MNWRKIFKEWQWAWLLPAVALGLLLNFAPAADIAVSAFFYSHEYGFYLSKNPLVLLAYGSETYLTVGILIVLMAPLLLSRLPRFKSMAPHRKAALYLLLVFLIGPGLIVNATLKNQWDRARPKQIEMFGGNRHFTPALLPSDQCERNCSFVSGHAALGFFFTAFGFVAARRRKWWLAGGVILGSLIGLARIAQGGHFLSDVVFAYCIVFTTAWIVHILMYRARR